VCGAGSEANWTKAALPQTASFEMSAT
jgi:hypothetical protein